MRVLPVVSWRGTTEFRLSPFVPGSNIWCQFDRGSLVIIVPYYSSTNPQQNLHSMLNRKIQRQWSSNIAILILIIQRKQPSIVANPACAKLNKDVDFRLFSFAPGGWFHELSSVVPSRVSPLVLRTNLALTYRTPFLLSAFHWVSIITVRHYWASHEFIRPHHCEPMAFTAKNSPEQDQRFSKKLNKQELIKRQTTRSRSWWCVQ